MYRLRSKGGFWEKDIEEFGILNSKECDKFKYQLYC